MSALPFSFALSLLLAQEPPPAAKGGDAPAAPQTQAPAAPQTIVQQIAALKQEFDAASQSFDAKYSAAKTDDERSKLVESDYPRPENYAPRFLALAAQAKGEPAALDCYLWVLQRVQDETTRAPIYAALAADHVKSVKLGDAVRLLGRYTVSVAAEKFLRAVVAATPHEEVKGAATYALAGVLIALSQLCETMASPAWTPELQARNERFYGKETLEEVAARDAQELAKEAADLLEDVVAAAKSVKSLQPLATQAAGDLYELQNLSIGQVAPDVGGFDVDAVHFNLSDYRGKVVVLDFWGFW